MVEVIGPLGRCNEGAKKYMGEESQEAWIPSLVRGDLPRQDPGELSWSLPGCDHQALGCLSLDPTQE